MVIALAFVAALASSPPAMSRDDIVARAAPGIGYSYHWGGACWQSDGGGGHGSCSGNCPSCTHSGSYGADCSGFIFKNWQIDGAESTSTCGHGPYVADSFHSSETHWTHITRANAQKADAFASSTHVVLYLSGDPWGTPTIDEARGCSYGIQHNTRSIGSEFNASQRNNIVDAAPPDWKATYVNQSFPYASAPAIQVKEGETVDGFIDMKNAGAKAWTNATKLAPTPRDQPSLLADASWLSTTRVVSSGAVAVGSNGHFAFTLKGGAPGEHYQTFGLVQESVAWFADSGGPADTQLEVRVQVAPRDHAAELVGDGFPKNADGKVMLEVGTSVAGYVDVKNDGHITWDDTVKLAPTPRDQASPIADASWLSPTRAAAPDQATAEGSVARFSFEIDGTAEGEVVQSFGLVHEGVTWFADAGFGPADDFFKLDVVVVPQGTLNPPPEQTGNGNGDGNEGGTAGSTNPQGPDEGDPNGPAAKKALPPSVRAGCAETGASAPVFACVALGLALVRRRRSAR